MYHKVRICGSNKIESYAVHFEVLKKSKVLHLQICRIINLLSYGNSHFDKKNIRRNKPFSK